MSHQQYHLDYLGLHDICDEGMKNEDVKQTLKEMRTLGYACGESQLRYATFIMNKKMFQPLYVTDTQDRDEARYIVGITDNQAIVMHSQYYDMGDNKYTYVIYPPIYEDTLLDALSNVVEKRIARDSNIDSEDIDKRKIKNPQKKRNRRAIAFVCLSVFSNLYIQVILRLGIFIIPNRL